MKRSTDLFLLPIGILRENIVAKISLMLGDFSIGPSEVLVQPLGAAVSKPTDQISLGIFSPGRTLYSLLCS